jgi:hypothetical protein
LSILIASFAFWRSDSFIVVVAVFMAAGVVVGCIKLESAVIWASLLGLVGTIVPDPFEGILEGAFWKPWTEFAASKYRTTSPTKIPSARV